jgi:hypothetical protein
MADRCPGQDPRFWTPDAVRDETCPACGHAVEFFKDDRSRQCPACGTRFRNPRREPSCADWCPFSAECVDAVESPPPPDADKPQTEIS